MSKLYIQQDDESYLEQDIIDLYYGIIPDDNGNHRKYFSLAQASTLGIIRPIKSNVIVAYINKEYFAHRLDGPALIFATTEAYAARGRVFSIKEDWFESLTPKEKILSAWAL